MKNKIIESRQLQAQEIRLKKILSNLPSGIELVSTAYKSYDKNMTWKCTVDTTHGEFLQPYKKTICCPKCDIQNDIKILFDAHDLATKRGGRCLTSMSEYKTKSSDIQWECSKGHKWNAPFTRVSDSESKDGSWCYLCAGKKRLSENRIRMFFETYFNIPFPCSRPKWNNAQRNKRKVTLELDGYCESKKIAFEYNGYQHYTESHWHKDEDKKEKLEIQLSNDKQKLKNCINENVSLLVFPEPPQKITGNFELFLNYFVEICSNHESTKNICFTEKQKETMKKKFKELKENT